MAGCYYSYHVCSDVSGFLIGLDKISCEPSTVYPLRADTYLNQGRNHVNNRFMSELSLIKICNYSRADKYFIHVFLYANL